MPTLPLVLKVSGASAALGINVLILGLSREFILLCQRHPHLRRSLLVIGAALVCFGTSALSAALYFLRIFLRIHYRGGLVHLLPTSTVALLDRPAFELVHLTNVKVMPRVYDWTRVLLLASADLDEDTRERILGELDREFRGDVFHRPALRLLPEFIQRLLLGDQWTPAPIPIFQPRGGSVGVQRTASKEELGAARSSLNHVLTTIRAAESGSRSSKDSSLLQKVLAEQMSDVAVGVMKSGVPRHYDAELADTVHNVIGQVQSVHNAVTTPPDRMVLRVPWEAGRLSLNLTRRIVSRVLQLDASAPSDSLPPCLEEEVRVAETEVLENYAVVDSPAKESTEMIRSVSASCLQTTLKSEDDKGDEDEDEAGVKVTLSVAGVRQGGRQRTRTR